MDWVGEGRGQLRFWCGERFSLRENLPSVFTVRNRLYLRCAITTLLETARVRQCNLQAGLATGRVKE